VDFVLHRLHLERLRARGTLRSYAWPAAGVALAHVPVGLGLWYVIRSVSDVSITWVPVCTGAMALAGVTGLVAVFAPAGIGVREGILLLILGQFIDPGEAAIVVVAHRVMQTVVEVALAAAGLLVLRLLPPPADDDPLQEDAIVAASEEDHDESTP
jgi:hypothetical protein